MMEKEPVPVITRKIKPLENDTILTDHPNIFMGIHLCSHLVISLDEGFWRVYFTKPNVKEDEYEPVIVFRLPGDMTRDEVLKYCEPLIVEIKKRNKTPDSVGINETH